MYAEVKMGHLYPTVLKIQLQRAHLHTATWKRGSMSHLLPCSQRHRNWFLQGSTTPHHPWAVPQDFSSMQWHRAGWAPTHPAPGQLPHSLSKAQPLDNADRKREAATTTMARPVAEKSGEAESILISKGSAVWKAKQQDPVGGTARPSGSPLTFLLQKGQHSSLKTVLLSCLCLWPHEALLTTAAIKSHCKNGD